jgi:iron-sulfur cluster repair protein YtfE (RIC family)
MSHACGCHDHEGATETPVQIHKPGQALSGEDTVGEVASRSPRALAVIQELGLNHCCGAHLTLTQASATAGVPVEAVLRRLDDVLARPV